MGATLFVLDMLIVTSQKKKKIVLLFCLCDVLVQKSVVDFVYFRVKTEITVRNVQTYRLLQQVASSYHLENWIFFVFFVYIPEFLAE